MLCLPLVEDGSCAANVRRRKAAMLDPQTPARTAAPVVPTHEGALGWQFDDDLAIGCECANPVLQIERWGQEEGAQPQRQ